MSTPTTNAAYQLLRASAGTGKTYRLVEAYVDLLQQGLEPTSIVVLTFTRKSALELQQRLQQRLLQGSALKKHIPTLAQSPIGNFHGLALRFLQEMAFFQNHGQTYQILGKAAEDQQLFQRSFQEVFLLADETTKKDLQELSLYIPLSENWSEALWQAISQAREYDDFFQHLSHPNKLWLNHDLQESYLRYQTQCRALILSIEQAEGLTAKALLSRELFLQASHRAQIIEQRLLKNQADVTSWHQEHCYNLIGAWKKALQALQLQTNIKRYVSSIQKKDIEQTLHQWLAHCLQKPLLEPLERLTQKIWQRYVYHKKRSNAYDFADLIEQLLLQWRNDTQQHLLLRQRVKAVLVDEAQDTNYLQRQMIRLLVGFDGAAKDQEEPAKLLVVGDKKQCIYTFRGADPQAFGAFAEDILQRQGSSQQLSISRRSSPQLIEGINHLSQQLFGKDHEPLQPWLDKAVDNDSQTTSSLPSAMYWCPLPEKNKLFLEEESSEIHKNLGSQAFLEVEAICQLLEELLNKYHIPAAAIAVLLPTSRLFDLLLKKCRLLQLPARLYGVSGFFQAMEIIDILSLLHWLVCPEDTLAMATALHAPLAGCSQNTIHWLLQTDQDPQNYPRLEQLQRGGFADLQQFSRIDPQHSLTEEQQFLLQQLSLGFSKLLRIIEKPTSHPCELLMTLEHCFQPRMLYGRLPEGQQAAVNIEKLYVLASTYQQTSGNIISCQGFIEQMYQRYLHQDAETLPQAVDSNESCIQIMTIHQSKGLQFDNVVLASLDRPGRQNASDVYYSRDGGLVFSCRYRYETYRSKQLSKAQQQRQEEQERERDRLLYVAITRAQSRLFFVGNSPTKLKRSGFGPVLKDWGSRALDEKLLHDWSSL